METPAGHRPSLPLLYVILAATRFFGTPLFAQDPAQIEFFEKKIRPVLVKNCQGCHNAKIKAASLDLTTSAGFLKGGQSGPLVSAEIPDQSRIVKAITYDESLKMPPTGKLKNDEIADITAWVRMGAHWPTAGEAPVPQVTAPVQKEFTPEQKNFWAFQPVREVPLPKVKDSAWIRSPVDRFILSKLEGKSLTPAPPADKLTLLRRATFDLTGLPPSEQEIRDFLGDQAPLAFQKVIDRLLASPRYGERWGRHWLDVARYADSTGNDEDHRYPYAWRYRDYVIQAFNEDLPYNQFVREQVAGDLLPSSSPDGLNRRGIVATGFLALGPKALAQQDKTKMLYDIYDEQVDVASKAFLGLTVSCARCHDHKFDPILTKDYYSLTGIFASTRSFKDPKAHVSSLLFRPLVPKAEYDHYLAQKAEISRKQFEIDDIADQELDKYSKTMTAHLADYLLASRQLAGDNSGLSELASQKNLQPDVLAKWLKFLQPSKDPRPYLDEWLKAAPGKYAEVAAAYQTRYEQRLAEWNKTLDKWRVEARKKMQTMDMPPPARPKFDHKKDVFFYEVSFKKDGPFTLSEAEREKVFSSEARARLTSLRAQLEELKRSAAPEPDLACAIEDGDPVNQKVFIRGDYNSAGEDAPKSVPLILAKNYSPAAFTGSGRLQLAEWLTRPDHPLTSRVMVNRIWQWHFGEGIVRTPDNFGKMGDRPSHPELLDYLAQRFVESGWSVKAMHRLLMLSNAYQMSSEGENRSAQADPENRLFSRFFRQRLDIEEIRDGMLASDGSLDLTMGGTLQSGVGTDQENSAERLSLNPEKIRRRTVYLPLRRANLPTLLNLFDFGDATTESGKRSLTSVAPQALFMMNSEFVSERAKNLVQSVRADQSLTDRQRVEGLYLRTVNRRPAPEEIDAAFTYFDRFKKKFSSSGLDPWQSFCHILLTSNEFIYLD